MKNYTSYLNYLHGNLGALQNKIQSVEESNRQIEQLRIRKERLDRITRNYQKFVDALNLIMTASQTISDKMQQERVAFMNESITLRLREYFPEHNYIARLNFEKGRADTVRLELVNADGVISTPTIGQGRLMQYIIGYAAIQGLVTGLNIPNVFIDEAFGVGSEERLPMIGDMLAKSVADGLQIVLVAQNSALYQHLPRREFHLVNKEGLTQLEETIDHE